MHIIGGGPLEKEIKDEVNKFNLQNKIKFYKSDTNVPELMSVMNFFMLPSLWEGFPVTVIEAQYMNLNVFVSDTVTKEVDIGLCKYIPIDRGEEYWKDEIIKFIKINENKSICDEVKSKFNILEISNKIEKIYDLGEIQ